MHSDGPQLIREPITLSEVAELARRSFGDMVKASVDVGRGVMAIGGDLHSDEEVMLLADGSKETDVWGINIYPEEGGDAWIEFDAMTNVRPTQGNHSRGVDNAAIRLEIRRIVGALIQR